MAENNVVTDISKIRKIGLFGVGDAAWQGGIQYITNIINALNAIADRHTVEVHLFKGEGQSFPDLPKFKNIKVEVKNAGDTFKPFSLSNRLHWLLQRKLQGRINPRYENYFLDQGFDYVFPATMSHCNGRLNVGSWIADFQYHHFPAGASEEVTRSAEQVISNIAVNTRKVILSSKYCEDDCLRLFPVSRGKTHVMPFAVYIDETHLAFRDFSSIRTRYGLPDRFLLVANLFAPTKNHKTLFDALGILKRRGVIVTLVCTGNIVDYRNHSYANEILQMLTENDIRQQVHLLGLIPRNDQVAMFRMSVAMVQPSVNEGWSTSVEEAKALGKNLLVSDIEVHLEQYGGNPGVFQALNAGDLANKIEEIWKRTERTTFPDLEHEREAYEKYSQTVRDFAYRFLEIAAF